MSLKRTGPFLICFVSLFILSCGGGEKTQESAAAETVSAESDEWREMEDFHLLMAESFHPYKDSANLAPAKTNAAELANSAEKWLQAPLPEKVNNDEVKKNLEQLNTDTRAFAASVSTASDEQIAKSLNDLHDLFHSLEEAWHHGGEHGHEHKH